MTVPLFKNDKKEAVRPIGIRNPLVRLLHKEVVALYKLTLVEYLESQVYPRLTALSSCGTPEPVKCDRGPELDPIYRC